MDDTGPPIVAKSFAVRAADLLGICCLCDVSGADATAMALFTLGLVCGATPTDAAEIANHVSTVVVNKLGTATVTPDELIASFWKDNEHD